VTFKPSFGGSPAKTFPRSSEPPKRVTNVTNVIRPGVGQTRLTGTEPDHVRRQCEWLTVNEAIRAEYIRILRGAK